MENAVCPQDGVPTVAASVLDRKDDDPTLGKTFANRFRIERPLGEGGMGKVYLATQLSMGRQIALKTLHPQLVTERRHLRRFYREAQAASQLTSPHVVRVIDFGVDEATGAPFIAMELLKGRELAELLDGKGALHPRRAAKIAGQVAAALREAEREGIVHRDLKPENIFLTRPVDDDEFVKVMDFGIAKLISADSDSGASALTAAGTTLGTPLYMAPEQIMGEKVDMRADMYSLGCILHEMLTGHVPFEAEDSLGVMMRHLSVPPPELPATLPNGEPVPDALRIVHERLLRKNPDERPGSVVPVHKVLAAIERGEAVDADAVLEGRVQIRSSPVLQTMEVDLAALDETGVMQTPTAVPDPAWITDETMEASAAIVTDARTAAALHAARTEQPRTPAATSTAPTPTLPTRKTPAVPPIAIAIVVIAALVVEIGSSFRI